MIALLLAACTLQPDTAFAVPNLNTEAVLVRVKAMIDAPAEARGGAVEVGPATTVPGDRGWCDDAALFPEIKDSKFAAFMRAEASASEDRSWPAALRTRVRADRARLRGTPLPLFALGGVAQITDIPEWNRLAAYAVHVDQPIEETVRIQYNGLIRQCGGSKYPSLTFRTGTWIVALQGMCWHTDAEWIGLAHALDERFHPAWLAGNLCGGETLVEARLFAGAHITLALPPEGEP